ncbi:far upstream element-binding protein 3-like isoform X30 [Bolinopsis microptera]|uniref:far upstream element-binding protein 3-like isoform X30 n=2 Tax=Bolinopsis microptera TaxID=2820187 RepID=UPI00307918D1
MGYSVMSVHAGSEPFNSALLRAKEIAAKLQSSKELNGSQDFDSRKRSFNGEEPVSKRPMMMDGGGYMNQTSGGQGNLKDEIRVSGSVIQYLSGETLGRLQAQTGCHVQIPPSGPDPTAERSITLTGNRQCIEHCKEQIKDIIHQYAPQTPIGGIPGTGGPEMMQQMGQVETVDMLIPQDKVGLVIGRGGETIKDLAVQSGCKMNMVQDGMYANAPEKPLRMHGTPFQIQKARELVSGIIQQQQYHNRNNYGGQGGGQGGGGGGGGGGNFNQNQGPFEATSNFAVGKEYVGIVIGRGGDTIKRLQSETGAKVQFNTIDPGAPGDRYLVIQGTKEQVAEVEGRVKDLLTKVQQKDNRGAGSMQDVFNVPANKCGLVIGKKGETINRMKEQTGAHIEMNKNSPHDAPTKQFFIKGTPEQIKAAKDEIAKIVGDGNPYGGGGGGGGGYGGGYPQQGGFPQQGGGGGGYNPAMMPPGQDPAGVQQQWAAYYQQLVQMYGEQQAQVYWTQLSQQQQQQGAAPQ